ncbi:unnamed protein product [Effrenium voratum]|nr:unnamed protein product [Effrenium voratum]
MQHGLDSEPLLLAGCLEDQIAAGDFPALFVVLDAAGMLSAPHARTREFLLSHGFQDVPVLLTDEAGTPKEVTCRDLGGAWPSEESYEPWNEKVRGCGCMRMRFLLMHPLFGTVALDLQSRSCLKQVVAKCSRVKPDCQPPFGVRQAGGNLALT